MPIIKSAKKRVKTSELARVRNLKFRRKLHDIQKDFYALIKAGSESDAAKMLPELYKTVDTCAKRNMIHDKKAARLKSKAQRNLSALAQK